MIVLLFLLGLAGESMHTRSWFSMAAQPGMLWPTEAQHAGRQTRRQVSGGAGLMDVQGSRQADRRGKPTHTAWTT